jgi:hypothetical protein
MAGVALVDDVGRLTRELWRLNMLMGFGRRTGFEAGTTGHLAKAAGATMGQVQAWMAGEVMPTTAQALAVLDALPLPATGPTAAALNGHAKAAQA